MSFITAKSVFRAASLCGALLIALAWPAHVVSADRTLADLNCQESVLASSSELNSDCGNPLLEFPSGFVFVSLSFLPLPAGMETVPVLHSRAPPLA
jgi:hypothetical protein